MRESTAEERLYKLFASRGMTFLQPLFGGSCACIGVTGEASQPRANILNRSSAVFRIAPLAQSDDDRRLYKLGIIIFGEQAVEFIQYIQMAVMLLLIHDI